MSCAMPAIQPARPACGWTLPGCLSPSAPLVGGLPSTPSRAALAAPVSAFAFHAADVDCPRTRWPNHLGLRFESGGQQRSLLVTAVDPATGAAHPQPVLLLGLGPGGWEPALRAGDPILVRDTLVIKYPVLVCVPLPIRAWNCAPFSTGDPHT